KKYLDTVKDLEFIIYLKEKMDIHDNTIRNIFIECQKKIEVEDLFNYLEYIKYKMIKEGLSLDNKEYPKKILNSQLNHVLDSFPEILNTIRINNLKLSMKEPSDVKQESKEIFEAVGFKSIIRSFFLQFSAEHIKAIKEENYKLPGDTTSRTVFFTEQNLAYWTKLEKYRDLNYYSQSENNIDTKEKKNLMIKKQFMSSYADGKILKFDFDKGNEWISEYNTSSSYSFLIQIYGDKRRTFRLNESSVEYLIEDLLTVYSSIYQLAKETEENSYYYQNKKSYIKIYGEKKLVRHIGVELEKIALLQLLSYDLNDKEIGTHIINYKPLIRIGKIYYILPSWIMSLTPEAVINKILSSDSIKLQSVDKTNKGHFFENTIETFFKNENIQFSKLDRDEDNNLPEIDGMFVIEDHLFLFDAKANIKPGNFMESYNYLQDELYTAFKQLELRTEKILYNKKAQKLIKQKTGIDVSKKIIAPFILLNHNVFNGYQEFKFTLEDKKYQIPIIDFYTLKDIIKSKSVPIWKYNEYENAYSKLEGYFKNFGTELYFYLLNQVYIGILNEEKPTFQCLEDGIIYKVVKPIKVK
ncbi:hypothetical protein C7B90_23185, partial [Lysinibacillus fusiformis]|uniref:hypothetical protein n=1 Tax=Lysinibacillus fusiformis TaxID=28031 RepID=UPI000E3A5EA4